MSVMDVFVALRNAGMDENLATTVANATDLGQVATKQDLADLRQQLERDIAVVKGEITDVRGEVADVRGEITDVKGEVADVKGEVAIVKGRLTGLFWLIGSMTILLGLLQGMPLLLPFIIR